MYRSDVSPESKQFNLTTPSWNWEGYLSASVSLNLKALKIGSRSYINSIQFSITLFFDDTRFLYLYLDENHLLDRLY